ncbi:transglycosylase domain-containing protein [Uliginosibacterium sp. H1]|uniref:transglycosylase domain-containing protein n=1 Tax=Uliginosibacterium sp. H1 TaxID=3114757 RepID=UPI002E1926DB|nr:transglycosylase domain-containing protein [Uliginosibacterium sp. H1]
MLALVLQACLACVLGWGGPVAQAADSLPPFELVRTTHLPSVALLRDRQGELLTLRQFAGQSQRLDWITLRELAPAMREALLVAEDRRFFEHAGVDWRAIVGAAWHNLWHRNARGASTLTMQLAGLLDPALRLPANARRSYSQKWDQSVAARQLEQRWSKPQILEAYVNLAPFRGRIEGLAAASELIFDLPAHALTRKEAVILAALLRGPNAAPEVVARRACRLAESLGSGDLCEPILRLCRERLRPLPAAARSTLAQAVLTQPGQRLRTTLDAELQGELQEAVARIGQSAAAVVLDTASGEVRAWSSTTPEGYAQRYSLGDAAWPYLAAEALAQRRLTAASLLDDLADGGPPQASLRTALAQGRSSVLLQVWHELGPASASHRLEALGFELMSLSDGGEQPLQAGLLQLAAAWRALHDGRHYLPPRWQQGEVPPAPRTVLDSDASFIVADMLQPLSRPGWPLVWRMGPARPGEPALLLAANARYVVALAVAPSGGMRPAPEAGVLDMLAATEGEGGEGGRPRAVPAGVVGRLVYFEPPVETPRREWFLRGTEPANSLPGAPAAAGRTSASRTPRLSQAGPMPRP